MIDHGSGVIAHALARRPRDRSRLRPAHTDRRAGHAGPARRAFWLFWQHIVARRRCGLRALGP
jgi:hypothetical protein